MTTESIDSSPVRKNGKSTPPKNNRMTMIRPDHPAARIPRARDPVEAHTADSTIRPPSKGWPGNKLNPPISRLVHTVTAKSTGAVPSGASKTCKSNQAMPAITKLDNGPTIATVNERKGVCFLPRSEEHTSELQS